MIKMTFEINRNGLIVLEAGWWVLRVLYTLLLSFLYFEIFYNKE